jgi:hypothetical protein
MSNLPRPNSRKSPGRRGPWRKVFPYYKVQVFSGRSAAWIDEKGAFDTIVDARAYITKKLATASTRIIVIEEKDRHVLGD